MESYRFFEYGPCGTCRRARAWLQEHGVAFVSVPIVDQPPSRQELEAWVGERGIPIRKWLNTSGQSYRTLVSERGNAELAALDDNAWIALMSSDGKLIKRPLLVTGHSACIGFREAEYAKLLRR